MKDYFKVVDLDEVLSFVPSFPIKKTEKVDIVNAYGRVLAIDIIADSNLPGFSRSTMDGFAVKAQTTFGATEGNPALAEIKGDIAMGETSDFSIGPGEAARISTGGALPSGADSVVMIEHTGEIDETMIEIYKSIPPGAHVIEKGEDFNEKSLVLPRGKRIRAQDAGLIAAFGLQNVEVYKKPVISVLSTGDEIVPVEAIPGPGKIRDINTYTLSGLIKEAGGIPLPLGIAIDDYDEIFNGCKKALEKSDMALISGGSSVGARDFTIDVLKNLPDAEILFHGISISPGKPTILAKSGNNAFWGLPGHVVSSMVVFKVAVLPFIEHLSGVNPEYHKKLLFPARISRNIASSQGRTDYVRVKVFEKNGETWVEPILGKSGLINTMVKADGLIEIGINMEGLDKGAEVSVLPV